MSAAPTLHLAIVAEQRPKTRADCARVARPCRWTDCPHNMAREVGRLGHRTNASTGECTLDLIEKHGALSLEQVAEQFDVSRQAIQQLEAKALRRARIACDVLGLDAETLIASWDDRRG